MTCKQKQNRQALRFASGGFTFMELMVTAFLTGLLASAVIASLTNMMQVNQQVDAKVTRQQELNRSLDFIGDEVQRASQIQTAITLPSGFPAAGNPVPILGLSIPNPAAPATPYAVIYYLSDNTSTWLGPKVLNRWGPPLDEHGLYTINQYVYKPLVDLMDDNLPSPNNTACPTGWFANPLVGARQGAYTCTSADGKLVNVVLRGRILTAFGKTSAIYEVSGQFVARSQ